MKGIEVLEVLLEDIGDGLLVSCNGFVSRELFMKRDRPGNFYLVGSMGLAASVGMGVALARPDRGVAVLDGDGNALMGLGAMANVAAAAPGNLVHVILDNGAYASTGAQKTVSGRVPLEEVARACGYARVRRVQDAESLRRAWRELRGGEGPACLLAEVEPSRGEGLPRVDLAPPELARRFSEAV